MDLEVTVAGVSLDDVIETVYDQFGELESEKTLGQVVVEKLVDRLTEDPRWDALAGKLVASADKYVRNATRGYVESLVAHEVSKQLTVKAATAAVRGGSSTAAEAIVATEVTTQLRAAFAPVVERALAGLQRDLGAIATESAIEMMRERLGRGR